MAVCQLHRLYSAKWHDDWEGCGRKLLWTVLRYSPAICL